MSVVVPTGSIDSIMVAPPELMLELGDTASLTGIAINALGLAIAADLTWFSLAPAIASVSGAGLVTARAPGSTDILATADGVTATVPTTVTGPPPIDIVVDGSGRRYGPLPVITFALVDEATGSDVYPLGAGEQVRLFGLFDTGTTRIRLFNEEPYAFQVAGDPNQGLIEVVPHRLTDGNYFASDASLLGLSAEEMVRVRLNGLSAIDPATLDAPFGPGAAELEVAGIPARPQPTDPRELNVSLIGGVITWSLVASIDYTTRVQRGPYDFYPGLLDRTEAGTGVPGFTPINGVSGPDIEFYTPGAAGIPQLPLHLSLRRVPPRYELLGIEFRNGGSIWRDEDPTALPWVHFDTGTTITFFGDLVANALGLTAGSGTFDCLTGSSNGYVIDAIQVQGLNGTYTAMNPDVCWSQSSLEASMAATTGSNLFDQVPTVFDGPANRYSIGPPTGSPVVWP